MKKAALIVLSVCLAMLAFQACKSKPEQSLLESYFNAITLNDVSTMSSMAVDPYRIDAVEWKIVSVSEEKIVPASIKELAQSEIDLKKQFDASAAPALDAKDILDNAKDDYTASRTAAARAAAKARVDAAQIKYDEAYETNRNLLKAYNEAKEATAKEEEITIFSLGAGQLPNIRDLVGDVTTKEVQIEVKTKEGETKNLMIYMKKYTLMDEAADITHRGRWVITKFEDL